jgi:DNA-binding NarL/FixJ family response regulator
VLLIEDDADMRLLVRILLQPSADVDVVAEAACSEDALELDADEVDPDVIVLDHHLAGGMAGIDAAPRLRARWPEARIVLFSGVDLHREAARCPALDGFVRKDELAGLAATLVGFSRRAALRRVDA